MSAHGRVLDLRKKKTDRQRAVINDEFHAGKMKEMKKMLPHSRAEALKNK